jgi:hypothetical protein
VIEPRSRPRPGSAGRGRGPDMGGGPLLVALDGTRTGRDALLSAAQRRRHDGRAERPGREGGCTAADADQPERDGCDSQLRSVRRKLR